MPEWPVVFRTASEIEASVVLGLLVAHGIEAVQSVGDPPSVFPLRVGSLGEVRILVSPEMAAEAERLIEAHRVEGAATVVPIRREFVDLEARLAYKFRDRGLLEHALTHRSRAHEDASGGVADNESLEFLGDAVLGLVVAEMLFRSFPQFQEGQKSKVKAALVSTTSLAELAERIGLGAHLILGRGEEKSGGRHKQALLADACEALIAALYLDGGMEAAREFILRELGDDIARIRLPEFLRDFKSALQEHLQAAERGLPEYVLAGTSGPEHDKVFHVEVRAGGEVLATADGRTKKDAEQEAARTALARLRSTNH
jgi:ribonuclease-3